MTLSVIGIDRHDDLSCHLYVYLQRSVRRPSREQFLPGLTELKNRKTGGGKKDGIYPYVKTHVVSKTLTLLFSSCWIHVRKRTYKHDSVPTNTRIRNRDSLLYEIFTWLNDPDLNSIVFISKVFSEEERTVYLVGKWKKVLLCYSGTTCLPTNFMTLREVIQVLRKRRKRRDF